MVGLTDSGTYKSAEAWEHTCAKSHVEAETGEGSRQADLLCLYKVRGLMYPEGVGSFYGVPGDENGRSFVVVVVEC
ncbi:MAG: hypothetical protein AAGE59_39440 [Cyanobacteria bacterium P01_F01_bin.86]